MHIAMRIQVIGFMLSPGSFDSKACADPAAEKASRSAVMQG
jgi:hypothetical protein